MTITIARGGGGRRREINVAPRAGPGVFNLLVTRVVGRLLNHSNVERKRIHTHRER